MCIRDRNYIFQYCRRLSSYKQEGVIYQIPKDFFSYATGITTLLSAFQAGPPGFLRGYLPYSDGGGFRGHGHRRFKGRGGADHQAV